MLKIVLLKCGKPYFLYWVNIPMLKNYARIYHTTKNNIIVKIVWFYRISTIVGYLMTNLYTYILDIYDL